MKYISLSTTYSIKNDLVSKIIKSFFILILFLLLPISIFAQKKESILLIGNITDSLSNQALEYANIMATDTTGSDEKIHFTMTDNKGNYKLSLQKMLPYKIDITYLGYGKKTKIATFSTSEASLNFKMNVLDNELGEVIVKSSIPPIIYKKDTILYNAASFSDGTERKLRELLQQMPGVEVDENNNIFVEGKRVTKLLVEGKPFFGGNSELAVKSLPADAVKTIEVLKEYNKVAFLSPISGDNELAMNIQLKEDKKRFVFGEIKGSIGWKKRWDARSDLFYYSPKINVYSIGGHNNINEELLSMDQFIQLQGGMSKTMSNNGGFSFNNSDIFNHISFPSNSTKSQSGIAATGVDFSFSQNYQLNSYLIYSDERKTSEQSFYNKYFLENDITLEEHRDNISYGKNKWLAAHTDFVYEKGGKDHLSITIESNLTNVSENQEITSINVDTIQINHALDSKPKNVKFDLDWSRKSNPKNISTTQVKAEWKTKNNPEFWTDETAPFLEDYLPWMPDSFYTAQQNNKSSVYTLQSSFKHYYIINKRNHFSGKLAHSYISNHTKIVNYQLLSEGFINDWNNSENKQRIDFNDIFGELTYRHKWDRTEIKLGTSAHELLRHDKGINNDNNTYFFILPFLQIETNIPKIGEVNFEYRQNKNLPIINDIYPNNSLSSFTSIREGNPNLGLESSHDFSLSLIKTNIFKHSNFFFRSHFSLLDRSIQHKIESTGINQIYSSYMTSDLYYKIRTSISYTKEFDILKIRPSIRWHASTTEKTINNNIFQSKQNFLQPSIRLSYRIKKKKKISLSYQRSFSWYRQSDIFTLNTSDKIDVETVMSIKKNWLFRANYNFISYQGGNQSFNHLLNFSLEYHKENSPYYFTLSAHNILNNKGITTRNTSATYISESTDFIFPFYTMFSMSYEL